MPQTVHQEKVASETLPTNSMFMIIGMEVVLLSVAIFLAKQGKNSLRDIGFRISSWWRDCLIGLGIMAAWLFAAPQLEGFLVTFPHLSLVPEAKILF